MAIFGIYVWENTLENFHKQILTFGVFVVLINTLVAISAMLGLIGIHKKIPMFVHIWAFALGCYLSYWAWWIIFLSAFAQFSVSKEV